MRVGVRETELFQRRRITDQAAGVSTMCLDEVLGHLAPLLGSVRVVHGPVLLAGAEARMAWSVSYKAYSAPTRDNSTGMPSLSPVLMRYFPRPGCLAPGCQESGADQDVTSSCSGPVSGVISQTRASSRGGSPPTTVMAHRSAKPRALARSSSVARASR